MRCSLRNVTREPRATPAVVGEARLMVSFEDSFVLRVRQIVMMNMLIFMDMLLIVKQARSQGYDPYGYNSSRFNESNAIGAVAIDHDRFYCFWTEWRVKTPTITAVELATGKLVWSQPARLALPPTFAADEGWLQYETSDSDQDASVLTDGLQTLHLVNASTGQQITIPTDINRRSVVEHCLVHRDRCLTFQGLVVNCEDGSVVGDLGPGEHQAVASNGKLVAVTRILKGQSFHVDKGLLREFRIADMQLEREMELSIEETWTIVATSNHFVLARCELTDRLPEIACFDLDQKTVRWRTELPKGVRTNRIQIVNETHAMFAVGYHNPIWPLQINLETGAISPVESWRDPQWILGWHSHNGRFADKIASNSKVIVGKWRMQNLMCVDAQTGRPLWNHRSDDHLITRVFCQRPNLGDYFVAETEHGFDIINVESGARHGVLPEDLGLERTEKPPPGGLTEVESDSTSATPTLLNPLFLGSTSNDWMFDQGIFVLLAIPILIWAIWAIVRWHHALTANRSRAPK